MPPEASISTAGHRNKIIEIHRGRTNMPYIGNNILTTLSGFSFLLGVVECFFGYRMLKVILGVTGFIVAGVLCAGFVHAILRNYPLVALLAGLLGGVIGSAMMIGFFVFGVFVLGASLGLLIGEDISILILGSANPFIVVPLVIAGGLVTTIMYKSMIIISTSFIGAYLMVFSVGRLIGMPDTLFRFYQFNGLRGTGDQFFITLLSCLLLGIVGMIVQYKYTGKSGRDRIMEDSSGRPM
jgi:hypothetical protein